MPLCADLRIASGSYGNRPYRGDHMGGSEEVLYRPIRLPVLWCLWERRCAAGYIIAEEEAHPLHSPFATLQPVYWESCRTAPAYTPDRS